MTTPLPQLAHCSALRLLSDRAVHVVFNLGLFQRSKLLSQVWNWVLTIVYLSPPVLGLLFCVGAVGGYRIWPVAGAAVACTPLHLMMRPLLKGTLIKPLTGREYGLIQAISDPAWTETLVEWARNTPRFDTRHLQACERAFMAGPDAYVRNTQPTPFQGRDARDLFDGQLGAASRAEDQRDMLTQKTDGAVGGESVRRL